MIPVYIPQEGEIVTAMVRFTNYRARRRCRVTSVKWHEIEGYPPFCSIVGHFQTNAGKWSARPRVLEAPIEPVPS